MQNRLFAMFLWLLTLCSVPLLAGAQTTPQDTRARNSSISGRATVAGNPLANKTVTAIEAEKSGGVDIHITGARSAPDAAVYSAKTDADGRYRLTALPAGLYSVSIEAHAYAPEKKAEDVSKIVTLDEDEAKENVDFALVRGGVITGRVTDAEGHPLIAQQVELKAYGEKAALPRDSNLFEGETYDTDDRGVYRLYGLPAGRYIVSAGGGHGFSMVGNQSSKYPLTYYPGVNDESQARAVEVVEGGEATEIDIKLGAMKKTYEATGRVVDAETGQPVPQVPLFCAAQHVADAPPLSFRAEATSDAKGNFRFNGMPSGQYAIQIRPGFGPLATQNEHYAEELRFEVHDGNVSGLEVRAKRGAIVSGVVIVEGSPEQKKKVNLGQTMLAAIVTRQPADKSGIVETPQYFTSDHNHTRINSDGSFRISGLPPGIVQFQPFSFTDQTAQLARLERDGVEMREGIEVRAGETVTGVRVVLAVASGVIRGQINLTGGKLPEGWQLTAIASRKGQERDAEHAVADGKGHFVIEGLLDGEYEVTVMAVSLNDNSSLPPTASQTVQIINGNEVNVTLTLNLSKRDQQQEERR